MECLDPPLLSNSVRKARPTSRTWNVRTKTEGKRVGLRKEDEDHINSPWHGPRKVGNVSGYEFCLNRKISTNSDSENNIFTAVLLLFFLNEYNLNL